MKKIFHHLKKEKIMIFIKYTYDLTIYIFEKKIDIHTHKENA